jgi:hypothetical protein
MTTRMNETTPLLSSSAPAATKASATETTSSAHKQEVRHHPVEVNHQQQHVHFRRSRSDSHTSSTVLELVADVKEEWMEVLQEDLTTPIQPREEGDHAYKLSAVALAVMVFYKVSGGPFGCEPTVKAAGPFYALLGFIVFPIFWCIPEALITAELGSAYPEPSGRKYI